MNRNKVNNTNIDNILSAENEQNQEEFSDGKYDGGLVLREMSVLESSEAKSVMVVIIITVIRCLAIVLIKVIDVNTIKKATWADYYILF